MDPTCVEDFNIASLSLETECRKIARLTNEAVQVPFALSEFGPSGGTTIRDFISSLKKKDRDHHYLALCDDLLSSNGSTSDFAELTIVGDGQLTTVTDSNAHLCFVRYHRELSKRVRKAAKDMAVSDKSSTWTADQWEGLRRAFAYFHVCRPVDLDRLFARLARERAKITSTIAVKSGDKCLKKPNALDCARWEFAAPLRLKKPSVSWKTIAELWSQQYEPCDEGAMKQACYRERRKRRSNKT